MAEEITNIIEDLYEIYTIAAYNKNISIQDLDEFEKRIQKMERIVSRLKIQKQEQSFVSRNNFLVKNNIKS